MNYPKLRYVEAFPIDFHGQKLICLRDPQNLSGKMLLIPSKAIFLVSLFDGKHSMLDIQEKYMMQFGTLIFQDEIKGLIDQLDEALMLESENYRDFKIRLEEEFKNSNLRESSHAGLSYPSETDEIKSLLSSFFEKTENANLSKSNNVKITGIISPHIDFRRGGYSYALAYRELIDNCDADVFIIFGTSHNADVENPFILTKKNFRTPFGEIETHREIVEKLEKGCNWDLFEGEIAHRTEHSIEFQIVFLQFLLGEKKKFKIVPILCNSFFRMIQNGDSPKDNRMVSIFLTEIKEIIAGFGDKAFVIAGADLAHVGLKFGDPEPVTQPKLLWIKQRDLLSLSFTENLDAEGFFNTIKEEKDERKICGLSPIYTLISTIKAEKGKILDYDQALESDTGSVVSFASVGFYS